MLEGLEALIALERCGTVSEAAVSLRLTQSAVSKRIQALQNEIGIVLTKRQGRKLQLTAEAKTYIEKATPLLLELKNLTQTKITQGFSDMSLAMADSIAASWGPEALWKALEVLPNLKIHLHAHRSALIIEAIRMGRYHMGLCATPLNSRDLVSYDVCSEPFVLMNSQQSNKWDNKSPILTIERNSASWSAIEDSVKDNSTLTKADFVRVESFQAAYQMSIAGFGNALLPLGLVKTMKLSARRYKVLPKIRRKISLITRKSLSEQQVFHDFLVQMKKKSSLFIEI